MGISKHVRNNLVSKEEEQCTAKCRKLDLQIIDLQLELFGAMVLPVITDGCEVWGFKGIKDKKMYT